MTTTKWAIDPMHTEVLFKVKHLVISTVTGSFKKFSGGVLTEGDDFNTAKITFALDVKSIDTNQSMRDEHLQGDDFFASDKYPHITFESLSFVHQSGSDYKMTGNLTMKGVTKTVELDVEYGGSGKDSRGNVKHGFEVTGKINRKDFGVSWNVITETGGLGLSEDIKLFASVQIFKEA